MPGGGCITAGEVRPGQRVTQRDRERKLRRLQPSAEGCSRHQLLAAGKGRRQQSSAEPYLGWVELHFSPPEGGLWGPQGKEGAARSTSLLLLLDPGGQTEMQSMLPARPPQPPTASQALVCDEGLQRKVCGHPQSRPC